MNDSITKIEVDEPFRFACSPAVACFNECCRDLNQFLYPYDILRLKNGLKLSSGKFLERYTTQHIGPESGLPIVALKTTDAAGLTCPFVTEKGCSVYSDRPASCRTYPLMRAVSRDRKSGMVNEHFMLLKEPHCLGFDAANSQTVQQWINDQEVGIYNHFNDQMLEIIHLKNQQQAGPLDLKSRHLFYEALYDLDRFKTRAFKTDLFDNLDVDPQKLVDANSDDTALLEVAVGWVKQVLFKS